MTREELRRYSREHLYYEINTLGHNVEMLHDIENLLKNKLITNDQAIKFNNARLESAAIHIRNLTSFLYDDHPTKRDSFRNDDVYALLYVKSEEGWKKDLGEISKTLRRARKRANREVGHLTQGRVAGIPPEKAWEIERLFSELLNKLMIFCIPVDNQKIDPHTLLLITQYGKKFLN